MIFLARFVFLFLLYILCAVLLFAIVWPYRVLTRLAQGRET